MTALRDTLRATGRATYVGGTVRDAGPQTVLERVGGPADDTVPGFAEVTLRAHVWGGDSYEATERDAEQLEAWFATLPARTPLGPGVTAFGATVDSNTDAPDPAAHRPRRVLAVRLTVLTHREGDN